jgi:hypothetical protein
MTKEIHAFSLDAKDFEALVARAKDLEENRSAVLRKLIHRHLKEVT